MADGRTDSVSVCIVTHDTVEQICQMLSDAEYTCIYFRMAFFIETALYKWKLHYKIYGEFGL